MLVLFQRLIKRNKPRPEPGDTAPPQKPQEKTEVAEENPTDQESVPTLKPEKDQSLALTESTPIAATTLPLTRTEVYSQLHKLVATLKKVDPQSPIASLLDLILSYEGLSFHEMISKYDRKGALRRIQEILEQDLQK